MTDKEPVENFIVWFEVQAKKAGVESDKERLREFVKLLTPSLGRSVRQTLAGRTKTTWAQVQKFARNAYSHEQLEKRSTRDKPVTPTPAEAPARNVAFRTQAIATQESAAEVVAERAEKRVVQLQQELATSKRRIQELETFGTESDGGAPRKRARVEHGQSTRTTPTRTRNADGSECYRCGGYGHLARECGCNHKCAECGDTHLDGWCKRRKSAMRQRDSPHRAAGRSPSTGVNRIPIGPRVDHGATPERPLPKN